MPQQSPVIFGFGNKPRSYVIGHGTALYWQNMPGGYEGNFQTNTWNALKSYRFFTGPVEGWHFQKDVFNDYKYVGPGNAIPFLTNDNTLGGRGVVNFISWEPSGSGWFIRYTGGTCQYASDLYYPPSFKKIMKELEDSGNGEATEFVAFGLHEVLLMRFVTGRSIIVESDDQSVRKKANQDMLAMIRSNLDDGWTFGDRSSLCPRDSQLYFIEWNKGNLVKYSYDMGIAEDTARVGRILAGEGNDENAVRRYQQMEMKRANDYQQAAQVQSQMAAIQTDNLFTKTEWVWK